MDIEVLGLLSPLPVPASRHLVQPVIGFGHSTPLLTPDPREVEQIFSVSLTSLKNVDIRIETRQHAGRSWQVPFFEFSGHKVWGATAMILSEFRALVSMIIN
jgi:hypothetical protein